MFQLFTSLWLLLKYPVTFKLYTCFYLAFYWINIWIEFSDRRIWTSRANLRSLWATNCRTRWRSPSTVPSPWSIGSPTSCPAPTSRSSSRGYTRWRRPRSRRRRWIPRGTRRLSSLWHRRSLKTGNFHVLCLSYLPANQRRVWMWLGSRANTPVKSHDGTWQVEGNIDLK